MFFLCKIYKELLDYGSKSITSHELHVCWFLVSGSSAEPPCCVFLVDLPFRGVPQSCKELPRHVSHDLPATAPRLGPLLPAMQRLVQQPRHGSTTLRWQKAQEERCQSGPAGAAGQDPGHGRDERYDAAADIWNHIHALKSSGYGLLIWSTSRSKHYPFALCWIVI